MPMVLDLSSKAAIVTGASRGLGRAMAVALAKAGADVVVASRNTESLRPVCAEIRASGGKAYALQLDVRSLDSIHSLAQRTLEQFGRIDILVNNAGTIVRKPAVDLSWDDWDNVVDTNLKGAFFCSQAVAPAMLSHGWGRIINIGSATCVMAYPRITSYCASRGGILQMTKSLASEWGSHGVTVNVLAPGWFKTEQTRPLYENAEWLATIQQRIPVGRMGEPADLSAAVVYLASEAAAYVNGCLFLVDGGFTTGSVGSSTPSAGRQNA